jgi:hypothetical protein
MKVISLFTTVAIALTSSFAAYAQDASPSQPETRADVKAQARAAEKSGEIPRGDASLNMDRDTTKSTANRASVKATTKAAEKAGQIPTGQASKNLGEDTSKSVANRAEIKQETKAAEKAGEIPRGEAQVKP